MPKYTSNRIDLNVGFNVDKAGLDKVKQSLQQIQNIKPGAFKGSSDQLRAIQKEAKAVQAALEKAFNAKLNSTNIKTFNEQLGRSKLSIESIYADFSKLGAVGQAAFSRIAQSALSTNLQLKQTNSLLQSFGNTMINTVKWGFASSIINGFTSSVQQAVSYVEGLDKSLTNIRIVTGDSREEMTKFAEEANRASQSLGRSTMDYTKAALSYYQQGLSDEQVAARTEATLKAQNITGAGDEMADYLTAVWNGYRVANEEAELYVDKMAAVADSSASNMAQLATAMSKVASTADMMGVPMDSLNAQIATIVATTRQAPESVGNALKTIYTRVADIKTGSQDAQISLGNYSSKMKEVGIDVLDSSGRFRDLGDIIEQIGSKWDGLSKEQQIYLARTMAGQRQINNLLALFNNWDKYSDLVTTSMESQGTTMEKNARYMESLGAHLNQLNAAQQRLKSSMIDSDSFKGLVDVGTGAVTVIANLVQSIGGGGTAILGLGSIITQVFSGVIAKEIGAAVTNFQTLRQNIETIAEAEKKVQDAQANGFYQGNTTKLYINDLKQMQTAWRGLSNQQKKDQVNRINQVKDLRAEAAVLRENQSQAQKFAEALTGVHKDISGKGEFGQLGSALKAVKNNLKDTEQAVTDFFNKFTESGGEIPDEALDALANKAEKLVNSMRNGATPAQKEFVASLKQMAASADKSKIDVDLLENELKELIQYAEQKTGVLTQTLKTDSSGTNNQIKQKEEQIKRLRQRIEEVNKVGAAVVNVQSFLKMAAGIGQVTAGISGIVNAFKALKNESLSTGQKVLQVTSGLAMSVGMLYNGYKQILPTIGTLFARIVAGATAGQAAAFGEVVAQKGWNAAIAESNVLLGEQITLMSILKALTNPVFLGIAAAVAISIVAIKKLHDAWTADARAAQQAAQNAAAASQAYDKVKESADQLKSSLEEYNSFQDTLASLTRGTEEWNQAIQQSNELVLDLINKFPELAEQVKNANGQLVLDEDAIETVQQNMNKQVQAASLNKAYAAAASREANITSQATDLSRQFSQQASNINAIPVNISGQDMRKIAQELNKFESGQLNINVDELNSYLASTIDTSIDVIEAIRNEETGIKQLQNAIKQNTNATKLQYEALATNSEQLQNSTTYQNGNEIQKRLMQTITASDLENATDELAGKWQNTLTTIGRLSDARNQDWSQQVLDAVSASVGEQLNWATNSIRGMGQNRQFVFVNENNDEVVKRADQIASMVAATKALDGLSESVTNASDIIGTIESSGLEDNEKTAIQEYIANQNFDNISKGTLEQLTSLNLEDIFSKDEIEDIANVVGVTTEELTGHFQDLAQSTIDSFGKAFDQLPDALAENTKKVFENKDLTVGTEKAIVQNLHNAIAEGGKQGYEDLLNFYSNIDDIQAFENLTSQLDFSTISASQFGDKLAEVGIETNLTNKQLQKYINLKREQSSLEAAQTTYKDTHDIVGDLQTGDIISPEDADKLKAAGLDLDKFFITTAQGGLKLVGIASQLQNTINELTLENFRIEIQKTRDLLVNAQNFKNNNTFEKLSSYSEDQSDVSNQLEFLSYTDVDPEQIANWQLLNEQQKLNKEEIQQITDKVIENKAAYDNWEDTISGVISRQKQQIEALGSTAETLSQLNDLYAQGYIDDATFDSMLKDTSDTQMANLGFNIDEYEEYVDLLQSTNQEYANNEYLARQMAKTQMRVSQGMEQLIDNWQDWNDVLLDFQQTGDLSNLAENWGDISQALANLFDSSPQAIDMLGPEFVTNNLGKIQDVKNGVEGAYEQLSALMDQELLLKAYGVSDFSQLDKDIQDAYNMIEQVSNDATIQVGAVFTGQDDLIQAFNRIVQDANWTSQQAQAAFSQMGYDVEVEEKSDATHEASQQNQYYVPPVYRQMTMPYTLGPFGPSGVATMPILATAGHYESGPSGTKQTYEPGAYAIKTVTKKGKGSGGSISRKKAGASTPRKSSGGGGKKSSGGGSTKNPTTVKAQKFSDAKDYITQKTDPYHDINRQLEKQQDKIDDIQKKEKKLVNRDRLKNLQQQNKELKKQQDLLSQKSTIATSELVRLRNELTAELGKGIKFDKNGQIANYNQAIVNAQNKYNSAIDAYNSKVRKAEEDYNKYIEKYNNMSAEAQQNAKNELEKRKDTMEAIKKAAQDELDTQKEIFDTTKSNLKEYEDTLDLQTEIAQKIAEIEDQIYENLIAISKIKVDLSIDTGDAEREWLKFEQKFIKKIDKDDFLGQAKANVKQLMSYFNSEQVQETANEIKKLQNEIAIMEKGGKSSIYGDNLAQAKEDLEDYMKQQMDDLQNVQDLVDDIKDNYLDAIDSAKDKMDQQISQYERINDLIDHNVKLTDLLYGDKAYTTMNKYYNMLQENNEKELDSLKRQQDYWQQRMNQQVVGSDAWNQFKKNLDDATDSLNNKLEQMINNLADKWENRVDGIIEKLNNGLTNGRGLDYIDEQWDYINNFDDNFLDTVNSLMGTREVERLYQQAIDNASENPKQQQKINNLMNQQLKILKEKNKLTEYDIERAKALLQVEQARMVLEDARNAKTKMRLRRDSQGNYTYQYVADEQKLNELQAALDDAQTNLYNQDKEHYKQNLNELYDTYKDYINKMKQLTQEYNSTQDEEERKRIQARIDLLKQSTNQLMEGLTQDNEYALKYLNESFFDAMQIDASRFTTEEQMEIMNQNIPQMKSNIQDLANEIVGQGGILNATADAMAEINKATQQYDVDVRNMLESAGTSLQIVSQAIDGSGNALDKNIQNAEKFITANEKLIEACDAQIKEIQLLMDWLDQYLNKVMNVESLIANLRGAYAADQKLNGSNLTADNITVESVNLDTTAGMDYTGNPATDAAKVKAQIDQLLKQYEQFLSTMAIATFDTGGMTAGWGDAEGRLAFLHQKQLVLNATDTENILRAVETVRNMTNSLSGFANGELSSIINQTTGFLNGVNTNSTLDQNVHIEASFPNVREHTEIEQAFENLVNMASMHASGYRD